MKILYLTTWFYILNFLILSAQDNGMQIALQSYNEGDYQTAIEQYEAIIAAKKHSLELFYNLGNSYYRNGNIGKAILNYERALLISPKEEDVIYNLDIARESIEVPLETINEFFLIQWRNNISSMASSWTWAILTILMVWLGFFSLGVWQIKDDRRTKILSFTAGIGLLLASFIPLSLGMNRLTQQKNSGKGIVITDGKFLHSAPDDNSENLQPLYPGYKVKILDQIENYYKVKLSNGSIGWTRLNDIEEIKIYP